MPYRAGPGSGLFGSSIMPDSRPKVDVGGALDALGNTANSLVQQAYQRKVNQNEFALRQSAADLQRQQLANETDYRNRSLAFEQAKADRDYQLESRRQDAADASAIAGLLPQGYTIDDGTGTGSMAASAIAGGGAPVAAPVPAGPRVAPPRSSDIAGSPAYQSQVQAAYSTAGPSDSAAAGPATPAATPAPAAAPAITIGGKRLVYKGYGASSASQAEQQRLADSLKEEAAKATNEKDLAVLQGKITFANQQGMLSTEHANKLSEITTDAAAKFRYALPKADDLKTAGLVPELVTSLKNIDQYDAPALLTKLGSRGTMGNYTVTPEGQQFNQSADQFLQALAFARSGKRITDQEIQRMRDAYIPKPGDSDQVLATKRKARQQAVQGTVTGSGRGANFINPDDLDYLQSKGYVAPLTMPPASTPSAAASPSAPGAPASRRVGAPAPATNPYVSKYGITP